MAIYISKLALDKIPSNKFLSATSMNGNYVLKSELFRSSKEFVALVDNPYKVLPVQKNDPRVNVTRRIKIALKIINQIPNSGYTLPAGFSLNSSEFDDFTDQAVKSFQTLKGLEVNGIVDALTLSWLDMGLQDRIFDLQDGIYLGSKSDTDNQEIGFNDTMDANGLYTYTFTYYDSNNNPQTLEIKDENIHYVQILKDVDSQHYAGFPISGINKLVDQHLDFSKDKYNNGSVLLRNIEKRLYVFAPKRLSESGVYTMESNDDITKIIKKHYYINYDIEIKAKGLDGDYTVFKIPKHEFKSANDTRSKFYMLLLYFYNLNSKMEEGPIKLNGVIKDAAFYNQLNKIFIHENKNPLNQSLYSTSKLPNFYSFLRSISQYSDLSVSNFTVVPGEAIRIPPKGFTEMLYYHLNFNPDLMLSGSNYVTTLPSTLNTSIATEIKDRKDNNETFWDLLTDTYQQAADKVVDFYNETLRFFKSAYQYVITQLGKTWPRGTGSYFDVGASVTWGIPIKTGVEVEYAMWREMSEKNVVKIGMSQKGKFSVGFDTGVEAGVGIGVGGTKRNKRINAGVYAQAGVDFTLEPYIEGKVEYEFTIEKNNTAIISMCMAAMLPGSSPSVKLVTLLATKVIEYFKVVNLDPFQYIKKMNFTAGTELDASGNVKGMIGVRTERDPNHAEEFVDDQEDVNKKKSWYSFNELLKYLDFNFELDANCKLIDFEYSADYEEGAFNPKTLTKMPAKVELQLGHALSASGSIGQNPGLTKLLEVTGISNEAAELSFDKGVFFYTKFDIELDSQVPGKIKSKSRSYKVGSNSGDFDFLKTGDEFSVFLDPVILKQLMSDTNSFTVAKAFDMIKSIQYRKKDGLEGSLGSSASPVSRITNWYKSKDVINKKLQDWVAEEIGIEFQALFDADITLKIADHPQYAAIRGTITNLMEFLMWWYGFISAYAADEAKIRAVRNWLWNELNNILNEADSLYDKKSALEFINEKIQKLVNKIKLTPIKQGSWQINLYNEYNFNALDPDEKSKYIKRIISEIFSLGSKAANFAINGVYATGWVMDIIFTKLFCYLRDVEEITFALEGGFALSGTINAKIAEGAKAAVGLDLEGAFFDRTVIKDKNKYTINMNDTSDPYYPLFLKIDEYVGPQSRNITDLIFNITK